MQDTGKSSLPDQDTEWCTFWFAGNRKPIWIEAVICIAGVSWLPHPDLGRTNNPKVHIVSISSASPGFLFLSFFGDYLCVYSLHSFWGAYGTYYCIWCFVPAENINPRDPVPEVPHPAKLIRPSSAPQFRRWSFRGVAGWVTWNWWILGWTTFFHCQKPGAFEDPPLQLQVMRDKKQEVIWQFGMCPSRVRGKIQF